METSAIKGTHVEETFMMATKEINDRIKEGKIDVNSEVLSLF